MALNITDMFLLYQRGSELILLLLFSCSQRNNISMRVIRKFSQAFNDNQKFAFAFICEDKLICMRIPLEFS